mgnify:CR=1 FL=1
MARNHEAGIAKLEKQITTLSNALAKLGKGTDWRELILIIKRPGWTTPAELIFTSAILDGLMGQLKAFDGLKNSLIKGSKVVGR